MQIYEKAASFKPQEIAATLWAVARLGWQLPEAVVTELFIGTADHRLSAFKPQELSNIAWSLAVLHKQPGQEWTNELLRATFHKLQQFTPQGLSNLVWAVMELKAKPPPAWMYSYVAAVRPQLDAFSALDLGMSIKALQQYNEDYNLQKVDDLIIDALDRLAAMELNTAAYAKTQVQHFVTMQRTPFLDVRKLPDSPAAAATDSSGSSSNGAAAAAAVGDDSSAAADVGPAAVSHSGCNGNGASSGSSSHTYDPQPGSSSLIDDLDPDFVNDVITPQMIEDFAETLTQQGRSGRHGKRTSSSSSSSTDRNGRHAASTSTLSETPDASDGFLYMASMHSEPGYDRGPLQPEHMLGGDGMTPVHKHSAARTALR